MIVANDRILQKSTAESEFGIITVLTAECYRLGRGLMIAPPSQFSDQPQRMVDGAILLRLCSY